MSSQSYHLYYKDCLDFVRTLIIKCEETALAVYKHDEELNLIRQAKGEDLLPIDEYDKTTWRYYRYLAGLPFPDQYVQVKRNNQWVREHVIRITSLDTHEEIDFTSENLKLHRATAREYRIGSAYYQRLIEKYPEHLDYIRGVIQPVDIDKAVNAANYTLLTWDNSYVEPNEYHLIDRIQDYIHRYFDRFDNPDYLLTDDLYTATRLGILYIYLPFGVMNIRYDYSRTNEAHSFHVWNYLGSHMYLDEYRDYMTLYQQLWFYRNIRWIEANPGKMETFRKLIQNVMTIRNLPISEFHVIHKTNRMKADPNVFYPDSGWKRDPLNLHDVQTKDGDERTIRDMNELIYNSPRDNKVNFENDSANIENRINRSESNNIPSKILESRTTDYSKIAPIKKHIVDLNEWIYMTTHDMYIANIVIQDPNGSSVFNFNMRQALIAYIYAVMQAYGLIDNKKKTLIPTIIANDVLRMKKPTIEQVAKTISQKITPIDFVHAADHYAPEVSKIIGTEDFAKFCVKVYDAKMTHRNMYSFTQEIKQHAQVKTVVAQYYETVVCQLAEPDTYFEDYFKANGFVFKNYNRAHWLKLSDELIKYSIGSDLHRQLTVSEIQGMMLRLLKQLSSYSVRFIKKIEDDELNSIDMPYMRYSKLLTKGRHEQPVPLNDLDISNMYVQGYHLLKEPLFYGIDFNDNDRIKGTHHLEDDLLLTFEGKGKTRIQYYIDMPRIESIKVSVRKLPAKPITPKEKEWDMTKFRIHKTTENRSIVTEDEEGNLIVRGVVYVDKQYRGKK